MRLVPRRRSRRQVGTPASGRPTGNDDAAAPDDDTEETVELHLTTVGGSGSLISGERDTDHQARSGGGRVRPTGADGVSTGSTAVDPDSHPDSETASDPDSGLGAIPEVDPASSGSSAVDDHSVRAARRRFVRRRWARRWLAWRRLVAVVSLVALLAVAVWLVFFSSVLAVQGVRVEGTRVLGPDAVRRVAEVPTGTPLATVDLDSVADRVERLPAVKSVDVSRAWPDRVRIDVTERRVVAVVAPAAAGERFRGTDEEGVVFRSYARRPPGLPLIRTGERTGAVALAEAAAVSGSLPPGIAKRVAEVRVRTVDTISLSLRDGRTVRWGSVDGSADKARVLAVLLRQRASFIDVSVPGQPVIRRQP